jgi:DNA-binding transcriptional MerR regulator
LKLTSTSAGGKVSDEMPCIVSGGDLTIGFNCRFLINSVRAADSEEVMITMKSPTSCITIEPAEKDEETGYRYYSADNMTQIRSIRSLQTLGLSLKEVAEYYYDTKNIDAHLKRLMDLRASLDRNIQMLQVRSAKHGDLSVHKTTLPRQTCYCRRYQCTDIKDAANNLRDTYIAAARTGKMAMLGRMFTMRMSKEKLDLMCCIPVEDSFDGPERVDFVETPALCIYYRGPYEGTANAYGALMEYAKENNVEITGPFRSIYMEGPPNRGENSGDYITQIAVPCKIEF